MGSTAWRFQAWLEVIQSQLLAQNGLNFQKFRITTKNIGILFNWIKFYKCGFKDISLLFLFFLFFYQRRRKTVDLKNVLTSFDEQHRILLPVFLFKKYWSGTGKGVKWSLVKVLFNVRLKVLSVFQIKDSIVRSVSNIQVNNLQSLTQVTSVIARATLEPSEVTFDTQVFTALKGLIVSIIWLSQRKGVAEYYSNVWRSSTVRLLKTIFHLSFRILLCKP